MKRKMSCLIVVLILSFSTCLTVSATSKYLTMDGIRWQAQKKTKWCWAACARNAVRYEYFEKGKTGWKSQNSIVKKVYGSEVNKGGTINQTKNSANYASNYTKTYKASNSAFSYPSLKTQIDQGDVILLFGSYNNGGGHVVTMHGYNTSNNKIRYFDPWDGGSYHTMTYSSFKNGTTTHRQYVATVYLSGN